VTGDDDLLLIDEDRIREPMFSDAGFQHFKIAAPVLARILLVAPDRSDRKSFDRQVSLRGNGRLFHGVLDKV
jgi:hypothetical protein